MVCLSHNTIPKIERVESNIKPNSLDLNLLLRKKIHDLSRKILIDNPWNDLNVKKLHQNEQSRKGQQIKKESNC